MLNRDSHVLSTLIRPAPNRPTFCAKGSEETKISTESFISSVLTSTTTTHSSIPHHHNNVLAGIENEPRCSPAEFSFLQISSCQEDCHNRCCQRPCRQGCCSRGMISQDVVEAIGSQDRQARLNASEH